MKTVLFNEISEEDQEQLRRAVEQLPRSLNKVTNPQTCVIACTEKGQYSGNNIFLSHCTIVCAEASALAAAAAAGDPKVLKVYLVIGRTDAEPKIVSPCGNCRQWLHDFARLNSAPITIFSATSKLDTVLLTDSDELLPEGFKSAGLGRMIGEQQPSGML